jgi:pSer/pThr/pTyr-binding forkhead associated (FHA) protein
MPKLIITTQSQGKIGYEFTEDVITIGRSPENMIVIEDGSVSSRHAQMEREGETYRLKDLGSTNGTRVNGLPVKDQVLKFDDKVRFGGVESRFESDIQGSEPLPEPEKIDVAPAEMSAAPVDFANASPFPKRSKDKDPLRVPVLAGAAFAVLAFFISILTVLMMQAPVL